jgi:hypothetical protein
MTGGFALVRANFTVSGDDFDFLPSVILADDSRRCTCPRSGRLATSLGIFCERVHGRVAEPIEDFTHWQCIALSGRRKAEFLAANHTTAENLNRERNCDVQLTRTDSRLTFQLAVKPLFPAWESRLAAGCFCCTESGRALSLVRR